MSWGIWVTGLPGSGKSTLARAAATTLAKEGCPVTVLELDGMRRIVTVAPTYSDVERDLVYRGLVWIASKLVDAGVPVIIDATAHRREWRDLARVVIPAFAEIQLMCGREACRKRAAARAVARADAGISPDPYARAGASGARVPGVDVEYEPAVEPELLLDTETTAPAEASEYVCRLARRLPRPGARAIDHGWAIWVTGLPGSGKTTLTSHVAKALRGSDIAVCVLELGDLLAFIAGSRVSPLAELIAHRTLVYAAKVLSEAGVPVIVDATAPARAWRELARTLIPHFAEVQLLCPSEVCATRERAVRWRLVGCPSTGAFRHSGAPDVAVAYEPALRPELIIHTDVEDPWSAAAVILSLAQRLHIGSSETLWTRAIAG